MRSTPIAEVGNFTAVLQQISERLEALEKCVSDMKQYEIDHTEMHRVLAAATGKNTASVQKTLAHAVTAHQQTMELAIQHHSQQVAATLAANIDSTRDMIQAMVETINNATGQEIEVHLPDQPERKLLDYDIIRGPNNLLSKIREVEQQ